MRFRETIDALYADGARIFVEAGPRGNMTAFIGDILRGRPACAVASDAPRRAGVTQLNHLVAQLAVHGVDVDVGHLFAQRALREVDWRAGGEPAPEERPKVPLHTSWPMLRLSQEAIDRFRAHAGPPAARVRQRGDRERPRHAGNGHADPALGRRRPIRARADRRAVARRPGGPCAPYAPVAPVTHALARRPRRRRGRRGRGPPADDGAVPRDRPRGDAGLPRPRGAPRRAAWPLLGEVVEHEPGVRLVARRSVDPDADPYLRDHTLGRVVSRTEPALSGLPLMPLAMSLEVLAEGAAALVGAGVVTGLRDVRAHRWIAFPGPLELEVAARRLAGARRRRARARRAARPARGRARRRGHRDRPRGPRARRPRRSHRRRTASARRSARPARCTAR